MIKLLTKAALDLSEFSSLDLCAEKRTSVWNRRDKGVALITTLLVMVLMSAIIVGVTWLVIGDQKLGGNNRDR